jgi:putative heme iron utilization protein
MSPGEQARRYLRARRHGALSTQSRRFPGYPFGSVAPFVLDHAARPVMLISRLAEHTRNIAADPHVSLLVQDAGEDVQVGARITLMGEAAPAAEGLDALRARYLSYFPDAGRLLALGDFALYRIEPRHLRYIGGFGDIQWIAAEAYAPPPNRLAAEEAGILEHMNAGPAHNLRACCRHYHGRTAQTARMAGIDCDGFDVRADDDWLRFDFERPVTDAAGARVALAAMTQAVAPP